jgi:purine-binding chemotaxis protein CheW
MSEEANNSNLWRHEQLNENRVQVKKYLIFKLNDTQYGVQLSEVKEVIGLPTCTIVPGSPNYFLGLINLRGKVISAIDMKMKLGIPVQNKGVKRPAVIIAEVNGITLGCVVDSISEVMNLTKDQIETQLEVKVSGDREFVKGIARFSDRPMILILDIQRAVDVSDLIRIRSQQAA